MPLATLNGFRFISTLQHSAQNAPVGLVVVDYQHLTHAASPRRDTAYFHRVRITTPSLAVKWNCEPCRIRWSPRFCRHFSTRRIEIVRPRPFAKPPGGRSVRLRERLENSSELFRRDPDAGIGNREMNIRALGPSFSA